jgi:cation-transporting ATPase I
VVTTSLLSAAALVGVIQTPGLSHFFGCRPLGPLGWGTAVAASIAATSFASAAAKFLQRDVFTPLRLAERWSGFPRDEQNWAGASSDVAHSGVRVTQAQGVAEGDVVEGVFVDGPLE